MDRWRIKAAMGLVCILTVSAFALTGCAQTEKSDVITIRIAHDNNVNTPLHKAFLKFKDLVETGSEGRMEVVIFPGGGGRWAVSRIHLNSAGAGISK